MIYFILFLFLKLFFSITAPILYPVIFLFRNKIRSKDILLEGYLYKWRKGLFPLWIYLNDSEYLDGTFTEYGDNDKYYPKWLLAITYKLPYSIRTFIWSYWFNAIRNQAVNFNNWFGMIYLPPFQSKKTSYLFSRSLAITELQFLKNSHFSVILYNVKLLISRRIYINCGFSQSGRFWVEVKFTYDKEHL